MEEPSDTSHSTAGTGTTKGRQGNFEGSPELYRSQTFPPEMVDQGWTAGPEAWNPPPRLRARLMASFDHRQHHRFSSKLRRLVSEGVRIPLPLAVTIAGLILGYGFWVVFRTPQTIVLNTSYAKPGPAVVFPAPEKLARQEPPLSKPSEGGALSRNLEKTPVFRGAERSVQPVARLDRVWLSPGSLRLEVDGVEVATSTNDNSGTAFWIQAGQAGGFILTLFPTTGSGPNPQGMLEKGEMHFEFTGLSYHLKCGRQLVTEPVGVWVQHIGALPEPSGITLGCAPTPDHAVELLHKGTKE
ncbi:MAG: hypothetical protein K1Y36_27270 [Blastocatellia bacterium]|nr:hypothetical protein [Blastocatellia bacterium]